MNILHIVEDFSYDSGGLRTVVKDLNFHLNQQKGIQSYIVSAKSEKNDQIEVVPCRNSWLYASEWDQKLDEIKNKYSIDVFHIHGVWLYPQLCAARHCVRYKIPFLVSTHGMYEPWLWKKGRLKKKLYFNLLIKRLFQKAKFLHAITPNEMTNLKVIFPKQRIVEIPNLINYEKEEIPDSKIEKYILFMGRITKVKGLDILIEAFGEIQQSETKLIIAGKPSDYKAELQLLIDQYKISKKVIFKGHVTGVEKRTLIRNAQVMVVPSYSEVIGMVNLEGAIHATPVITTFETGLHKAWSNNGGILIHPNKEDLQKALKMALQWNLEQRKENGEKLQRFVIQNYSWQNRIGDWLIQYKRALHD